MSAALASITLAATSLPLAMILSATPMVATPATAMVRLPPVIPSGVTSESPWTMRMLLESMPSRAEAIWVMMPSDLPAPVVPTNSECMPMPFCEPSLRSNSTS